MASLWVSLREVYVFPCHNFPGLVLHMVDPLFRTPWNEDTLLNRTHLSVPNTLYPSFRTPWNEDTSINRTHLTSPNTYSGHPENKDTLLNRTHLSLPNTPYPLFRTLWNEDTLINRTHLAVPTPYLPTLHLLKSGHLTNKDVFCPTGVQIREVPLKSVTHCLHVLVNVKVPPIPVWSCDITQDPHLSHCSHYPTFPYLPI